MLNNMKQLFAQAKKMQADMEQVQKDLDLQEVVGEAASGAVTISMSANGTVKSVHFDPKILNPEEHELVEDLFMAAYNDAKRRADEIAEKAMKQATGGLKLPF